MHTDDIQTLTLSTLLFNIFVRTHTLLETPTFPKSSQKLSPLFLQDSFHHQYIHCQKFVSKLFPPHFELSQESTVDFSVLRRFQKKILSKLKPTETLLTNKTIVFGPFTTLNVLSFFKISILLAKRVQNGR